MVTSIVFLGEIPGFHECDGNSVAENHLDCGGGHRSEVEGTELSLERQMDVHIAEGGEGTTFDGSEGDEANALGSGAGDEAEELIGGAGLTEKDEDI
jgi:hypothetical protein